MDILSRRTLLTLGGIAALSGVGSAAGLIAATSNASSVER